MMSPNTPITSQQFHEADGTADWRILAEGACACFTTGSVANGARLVSAISELPSLDAHHPDIDVRFDTVTVRLITYTPDYFGLSARDLELAQQISGAARRLGFAADPAAVRTVFIAIDAMDVPAVLPFWRAILGYVDREDSPGDLVDPLFRGPSLWFQEMDAPRPQRNRIHIDVWAPHDQAEARIAAALEAGGTLVTDQYAPSWWVLADPEGNEVCLGTWQTRD